METWDIYDDCFFKTGDTIKKCDTLTEGENRLISHIYPVNSKGEILIQQRNKQMRWKPGMWAATSGSAIAGEDGFTTCQRELEEELGIKASRENTIFAFMNKRRIYFCEVWIVTTDATYDEMVLQPAEVIDVKWAKPEEIREMIQEGKFINYHYMDYLFSYIEKYII